MFLLTNMAVMTVLYTHFPDLKFFIHMSKMDAKPGNRPTTNKTFFSLFIIQT